MRELRRENFGFVLRGSFDVVLRGSSEAVVLTGHTEDFEVALVLQIRCGGSGEGIGELFGILHLQLQSLMVGGAAVAAEAALTPREGEGLAMHEICKQGHDGVEAAELSVRRRRQGLAVCGTLVWVEEEAVGLPDCDEGSRLGLKGVICPAIG